MHVLKVMNLLTCLSAACYACPQRYWLYLVMCKSNNTCCLLNSLEIEHYITSHYFVLCTLEPLLVDIPNSGHLPTMSQLAHVTNGKQWICMSCNSSLSKGVVPVQSKANGMDLDAQPPELSCLNALEQRLISLHVVQQIGERIVLFSDTSIKFCTQSTT